MKNSCKLTFFQDGNWGAWSLVSSCSVSCNGGTQTRTRSCDNPLPVNLGKNCYGESTETTACSESPCPVGKHQSYYCIF
jgi:hypothetical protein